MSGCLVATLRFTKLENFGWLVGRCRDRPSLRVTFLTCPNVKNLQKKEMKRNASKKKTRKDENEKKRKQIKTRKKKMKKTQAKNKKKKQKIKKENKQIKKSKNNEKCSKKLFEKTQRNKKKMKRLPRSTLFLQSTRDSSKNDFFLKKCYKKSCSN